MEKGADTLLNVRAHDVKMKACKTNIHFLCTKIKMVRPSLFYVTLSGVNAATVT